MAPDESSTPHAIRRRRGDALDHALLASAWKHLGEVGYSAFAMDAVAAGAGTSKTVVYRRWKTRAELVLATMRAHASAPPIGAESGTLRGDVLAILQWLADRFHDYPDVVRGLMAELPDAEQPVTATSHDALEKAVRLAIERGEIVPAEVSERRISVPIDLLRHQMFVTRRAATREEIEEIVDGVFLPLICDPRP